LKDIPKPWYPLALEFRRKLCSSVETKQLLNREIRNRSGTVCCPVHRIVMNHHESAVLAGMYIEFNARHAKSNGAVKSSDCVFGSVGTAPPVRFNEWWHDLPVKAIRRNWTTSFHRKQECPPDKYPSPLNSGGHRS